MRTFSEIAEKIQSGKAVVVTSEEVFKMLDEGRSPQDVDVVTTATRAVMSGTYAVLSFPAANPGDFVRADRVFLNGVPAQVGPCPNENLGVLDLVVFGTAHSAGERNYGGGHLFKDLVQGKEVGVDIEAGGRSFSSSVTLDEIPHARIFGSRHAFKNYSAFVNAGQIPVSTIFHAGEFPANCVAATFSGCGEVNPLKNDPLLDAVGPGSRILMNGAEGFVIGTGTRSTPDRPNLAGYADMHSMEPGTMGGFKTSAGPECIVSWAVPIPVLSDSILKSIAVPDREIPLPVMDVSTRKQIGLASYADVWRDSQVNFDPSKCSGCARCAVEARCPVGAVGFDEGRAVRDEGGCFHCGLCVFECPGGAFSCDMGSIKVGSKKVPVVLRQSDRCTALRLAEDLKKKILDGSFVMAEKRMI